MNVFFRFWLLCFMLSILCTSSFSQSKNETTIMGSVYDAQTQKPLKNANVYLLGTLKGSTTDENGKFIVRNVPNNSFYIVVSYVGYQTQKHSLKILKGQIVKRNFYLKRKVFKINEITVDDKGVDEWRKNLKIFKEQFIGILHNSIFTQLLNPYAINFTKTDDGWLSAKTNEPLILKNDILGYDIKYYMDTFLYKNSTVKYSGQPFFQEMNITDEKSKENINEERMKTYCGSLKHFLHIATKQYMQDSIKKINNNINSETKDSSKNTLLEKHGFKVFHVGPEFDGKVIKPIIYPVNPDIYFHQGRSQFQFYLKFPDQLKIIYLREHEEKQFAEKYYSNEAVPNARQISWIFLPADSVLVDTTGYYFDSFGIQTFGYWSFDRASNMLPYEYSLPDSILINYYEE